MTQRLLIKEERYEVSIHTPTQGVTVSDYEVYKWHICFNPHTHAGCDTNSPDIGTDGLVSIHTPTQGVTKTNLGWLLWLLSFNPHTHAGCDEDFTQIRFRLRGFNPHTHAGCDYAVSVRRCFDKFQSTHPRRVWLYLSLWYTSWADVSIHTPTQGVTLPFLVYGIVPSCFNPHTHAGCDHYLCISSAQQEVSIHTPTQGVTNICSSFPFTQRCFNPHTHAGCDHDYNYYRVYALGVSIHTPTQGVTDI